MSATDDRRSPSPATGSAELPAACAAFRGRLSGYLDGTVAESARVEADAHVAACRACRRVADETEAAERGLARLIDADAAAPLPEGFAGAILARTVHEHRPAARPHARPGLVPWLGWVAAAAAVLFTVVSWSVDGPGPAAPGEPAAELVAVRSAPWQVSATLDGPAAPASLAAAPDLAPLFAAATLLEAFAEDADPDGAGAFAARVVDYDRLLPRLATVARTLPPDSAATVEMARGVLQSIAEGDARQRTHLQRQLAGGELAAALRRLEGRLAGPA